MSKKKKIIISATATVLVLATALAVIVSAIGRQNDIKKAQEEYEQAQNAKGHYDTREHIDTTDTDSDIPSVSDGTGNNVASDNIILDVTDKDRDPDPGIVDAKIE